MKNYLSVAQKWADVKNAIVVEHERVAPMVNVIVAEYKSLSGQSIPSQHIDTPCEIQFYPSWEGGFAYNYSGAGSWHKMPHVDRHWEWSLKESQEVLDFLKSLHEEEVKILFRKWCETHCV